MPFLSFQWQAPQARRLPTACTRTIAP